MNPNYIYLGLLIILLIGMGANIVQRRRGLKKHINDLKLQYPFIEEPKKPKTDWLLLITWVIILGIALTIFTLLLFFIHSHLK